ARIPVMASSTLRLLAVLSIALTILTSAAQGRTTAPLSMNVNFAVNGAITVSLPNGTAVGSTSGSPTVVPAGYYVVELNGPGGCPGMPPLLPRGPRRPVLRNLHHGESRHVACHDN